MIVKLLVLDDLAPQALLDSGTALLRKKVTGAKDQRPSSNPGPTLYRGVSAMQATNILATNLLSPIALSTSKTKDWLPVSVARMAETP